MYPYPNLSIPWEDAHNIIAIKLLKSKYRCTCGCPRLKSGIHLAEKPDLLLKSGNNFEETVRFGHTLITHMDTFRS